MALQRMEHTGAAPATGLASGINNSVTSFSINSGTGYPTGAVGPFILCLDPGTGSEEKVLCSSRSGTTVTVAGGGRGYDGTAAAAHSSGSTNVQHVLGAIEVDDDNDHVYTTTRDDHSQYARTDGTRAFTGATTVSSGGFTVTTGGLTVSAGTTAVQALTATTGSFSSTLGVTGAFTGSTVQTTGLIKTTGANVTGQQLQASGVTGASASVKIAGGINGGPPSSGSFVAGDCVIDTLYGMMWQWNGSAWIGIGCGNLYTLVYRATGWTTAASATEIAFDTALSDPNSMVNLTTGTATLPVAGVYQLFAQFRYTSGAATDYAVITVLQNATTIATLNQPTNTNAVGAGASISCLVSAAAADTIKVQQNTSTSGRTGNTGQASTFMHLKLAQ